MKVLIYGGGSVGLALASFLSDGLKKIDFINRKETSKSINDNGIFRTGIFGEKVVSPNKISSYESLEEVENKIYDFILVCTKTNTNEDIAKKLSENKRLLDSNSKIIICQNGWGNTEKYLKYFEEEVILNARIITGFYRYEINSVAVTAHSDDLLIGSLFNLENNNKLKELCDLINEGGLPCKLTKTIEKDLWSKMLFNCCLNPLGAIFNVRYGDLGKSEYTQSIMNKIIDEIFEVIYQSGNSTYWKNSEEYKKDFYSTIYPPTINHESSMLQDIRKKNKTEINSLNGIIVEIGKKLGINVSTNENIVNMIKFLESKY